jgi:hypothetical protein
MAPNRGDDSEFCKDNRWPRVSAKRAVSSNDAKFLRFKQTGPLIQPRGTPAASRARANVVPRSFNFCCDGVARCRVIWYWPDVPANLNAF